MSPVLFPAAQGSRDHKASEKQVAMIAQKVMDANQTQHEGRSFITATNLRTAAFWAFLADHQPLRGPASSGFLACAPLPGRSRVFSFSISPSIF